MRRWTRGCSGAGWRNPGPWGRAARRMGSQGNLSRPRLLGTKIPRPQHQELLLEVVRRRRDVGADLQAFRHQLGTDLVQSLPLKLDVLPATKIDETGVLGLGTDEDVGDVC